MGKGTVIVKIVGDAKGLAGALGEADGALGKFGKGVLGVGAAVGTAAVAAGAFLLDVGAKFDDAYDTIRVGTGATGAALKGLQSDFKAVVQGVPASFGDASTAIADLNTRTGQTGKGLQDLAKASLELARLTGGDLTSQIASTTRLFGDWSIAVDDQTATLDKLFRASQATGIGVDQLSAAMVQFGAPLRQMGFSFDEATGLLAKFEKEGVNGELVMGSLRIALGKLARDGKEPVKAFQEQVEAIKAAGDAGKANALALELFGARAGPDMAAAIREGRFELGDLLDTISNGGETIAGAAADTADFGEKWTMLKNRVFVALEPVAARLFDAINKGMDALGPIFTRVSVAVQAFAAGPFGQKLVEAGRNVMDMIGKVVDAISSFVDRFRTGGDDVGGTAGRLQEIVSALAEMYSAAFGAIQAVVTTVVKVLSELWDRFGGHLVTHLRTSLNAILDILGGAIQILTGVFNLIKAILTGKWGEAWDAVKQILGGAWDAIGGVLRLGINAVSTIIGGAMAGISAAWSVAWNALKTVVSDIWSGIAGFIRGQINQIIDGINVLIRAFNKLPGPDLAELGRLGSGAGFAAAGGGGGGGGAVFAAASGFDGMVTGPTMFLAGEAGPERVSIIPASRLAGAGGGGSGTLVLEVPVVVDGREIARTTVRHTWDELRRLAQRNGGRLALES